MSKRYSLELPANNAASRGLSSGLYEDRDEGYTSHKQPTNHSQKKKKRATPADDSGSHVYG